MSSLDYAIDLVRLSKRFRRRTLRKGGYTTIKSALLSSMRNIFRVGERDGHYTEAIKDLTIRVPQGASVGIIGQNGSGKSTLLKLITGIYRPDSGTVSVNGRVAALIELGAGFHPDFTGRENLFLGGVMHGLTKAEIEQRFDEIVAFAELQDVIDDPVKTYSSGMFMRLGFSLAVHTDPDVLLIDEVLAVGDAAFVAKCKERITRLRKEGKTLLLVSHDLGAVERWCDESVWLHKGAVMDRGDPRRVIDHYRAFIEKGEEQSLREQPSSPAPEPKSEVPFNQPQRWGSREIELTAVRVKGASGEDRLLFHPDDSLVIEADFLVNDKALVGTTDLVFGIGLTRSDGLLVHGSNTDIEKKSFSALLERGTLRYEISRLGLLDGRYFLDIALHRKDGYPYDYHKGSVELAVRSPYAQLGVCVPPHEWRLP